MPASPSSGADGLHRHQAEFGGALADHRHQFLVGVFAEVFPAADRARVLQLGRGFAPAGAGLEPEDLRRDVAGARGVEQEARHLGVGLGLAEIQFVPVVLAQRLRIDADHGRDVRLRNAVGRHRLDLPALRWIGLVRAAAHQAAFAGAARR